MASDPKGDMSRGRPDPDPTVLTTDALNREVAYLKERMDDMFKAERELNAEKFRRVDDRYIAGEANRKEQKEDTLREITKAFNANAEAIGAVEKTQNTDSARISAIEAGRQGGIDMRVAILGFISIGILIFTVLAANGVFSRS